MRNFPPQYNLRDEDVLYFSHIPKTAGMTFRTIVEDHFHCDEICPATLNAQVAKIPQSDLQKYRLFRGHLGFINLPELLPGKKIINVTVLREPVSRVISHYEYIRRMPGDPHYAAVKDMTLEEFSQKLTAGKVGKNIQTYHVAKATRFTLEDLSPAEILEIAKESLDQFAFVGLVERFQDSLSLLSYILGWKPILNSRKENAAKSKPSSDQIPASTLEVIRENTLLDHELYQYAKEIFETRFDQMTQELYGKYVARSEPGSPALEQPLSSEQMFNLLEQHYEQRYADSQVTPPGSAFVYDFSQALRGSGWQRREYPQEFPTYRWTGPTPVTTLDLPLATHIKTDLLLEFRVICTQVTDPDILASLAVEINGHPIELMKLHSDRAHGTILFQGVVPRAALSSNSPLTKLVFRVDRVTPLSAVDPRDSDSRLVGLALNLVQVFPINLERERSASLQFFECETWQSTADFLKDHVKPGDTVAGLLAFRVKLPCKVLDYDAFAAKTEVQWVVIHKGRIDEIGSILSKLLMQGFFPVFANEVFVVFSNRRGLSGVNYASRHVRPLYIDRLKRGVQQLVKPIYFKYFFQKADANQLQGQS